MNVSKVNDINVSSGLFGRTLSRLRTGISNLGDISINRKKGFENTTKAFTGNVISAYKPVEHYELPKKTTWQKITSLLERKLIKCLNSKKIM